MKIATVWQKFLKPVMIGAAVGSAIGYAVTMEARAQALVIHGVSHHSKDNEKYNNQNFGIGYRTSENVLFGTLKNSQSDQVIYAGYQWFFADYFSLTLGGAVGYKETPVMPLIALSGHVPVTKQLNLNLSVLPMEGRVVFHSGIEWRF